MTVRRFCTGEMRAPRARLLLPPVPESYFCRPQDKPSADKLRISFAGRVDPGKGAGRVIEVFERLAAREDIELRLCGFCLSQQPETVALHERLLANPNIRYEPAEHKAWTPEVDDGLCRLLRETDILLLPYVKLSSTVDTPLLLLEGMANLCAIVTPPLGDLHATYGESEFNLPGSWSVERVVELIDGARPRLAAERQRLATHCLELGFDVNRATDIFRSGLGD